MQGIAALVLSSKILFNFWHWFERKTKKVGGRHWRLENMAIDMHKCTIRQIERHVYISEPYSLMATSVHDLCKPTKEYYEYSYWYLLAFFTVSYKVKLKKIWCLDNTFSLKFISSENLASAEDQKRYVLWKAEQVPAWTRGRKSELVTGKAKKEATWTSWGAKHATAGKTTSDLGRETNQKLHENSERKCLLIHRAKNLSFHFIRRIIQPWTWHLRTIKQSQLFFLPCWEFWR